MVTRAGRLSLGIGCALVLGASIAAHEVPVHRRITRDAIELLGKSRTEWDSTCRAGLTAHLTYGAEQEDAYYEQVPVGRFFFHFLPRLDDVPDTIPPYVSDATATCDSVTWGHTGNTCYGRLQHLFGERTSGPQANESSYHLMIQDLRTAVGTSTHTNGLVALGRYLHLLQDLTSPAHTRNDAHPHLPLEYPFDKLGDPSAFEIVNVGREIPPVTKALETFPTPRDAFDRLRAWTASRFWSEKNTLATTTEFPGPAIDRIEGWYAFDADGRPIARRLGGRWTIDDRVARAQFDELAPEAVRYTASMIDHIIRVENVKLCAPPPGERYRAIMIPPPYQGAWEDWVPTSMNGRGHVALFPNVNAAGAGAIYIWNGTDVTYINANGGHIGWSGRLNDADHFVLTFRTSETTNRALVWKRDFLPAYLYTNAMQDIGTLGGPSATAQGINNSGVVFGSSTLSTGEGRGFRWNGSFQAFNLGPPGSKEFLGAMNDLGHVCGGYWIEHPYPTPPDGYAVIWDGSQTRTLPKPPRGSQGSPFVCTAMDDHGNAVGWVSNYPDGQFAYLWNGSAFVDLGDLGDGYTAAAAMNDLGAVVGTSRIPPATPGGLAEARAVLWKDGRIRDLNGLVDGLDAGWTVVQALGINNAGQIAARVFKQGVGYRAVRLDPL